LIKITNNGISEKFLELCSKITGREKIFELSISPVKGFSTYVENYDMHDIISEYVKTMYEFDGRVVFSLGIDVRIERKRGVKVFNTIPDYGIEIIEDGLIVLYDVKAKSKIRYFGKVNKREIDDFRMILHKYGDTYNLKIYIIYGLLVGGKVLECGYSDIMEESKHEKKEWNGNTTYNFDWCEGLPYNTKYVDESIGVGK